MADVYDPLRWKERLAARDHDVPESDEAGDHGDLQSPVYTPPGDWLHRLDVAQIEDIYINLGIPARVFKGSKCGDWEHRLNVACLRCGKTGNVLARGNDRHCSKCHRDWTV